METPRHGNLPYYHTGFAVDLHLVMQAMPSPHDNRFERVIQPRMVSLENPVVERWPGEQRNQFALALFFSILVDQVCYTHFPHAYPEFRRLTQYPKWKGDCPGGCRTHIHPSLVFRAVGAAPGQMSYSAWGSGVLLLKDPGVVKGLHDEVIGFLDRCLRSVAAENFWTRCLNEFPKVVN